MPTRGIVSINGEAVTASTMTTEQLVVFIFEKLKTSLVNADHQFIWRPEYLFENIMIYMMSGEYEQLRHVTRDQGLKYAVEELRQRFASGQNSGMDCVSNEPVPNGSNVQLLGMKSQ